MSRKRIYILLVVLTCLLSVTLTRLGLFSTSDSDIIQVINKVFAGNSILVNSTGGIELDKVTIQILGETVFEKGKYLNNIKDTYGGPNFDVFYDDKLIGTVYHYNTNDWYVNQFKFDFYFEDNHPRFICKSKWKNWDSCVYIWIAECVDSVEYKSFDSEGKIIRKWMKETTNR
ncbi:MULTISPECIES: hypothetical protein [unclassified Saccharicrinis]|uniref:hypothetical protein n=1 Tax=unclassified Saccharicrinis TaxID=2646859 RepID=UPI003D345C6C